MTRRVPDPADPFEEAGLASPDPEYAAFLAEERAMRIERDPEA